MSDLVKRYAPEIYKDNDTMNSLYEVQSEEMDYLREAIVTIVNNTFIQTSNLDGIRKMERLLNMKDISNEDDLETRRENVLNKLVFRPGYSRQKFVILLNSLFGEGNYVLEIYPSRYEVVIDINIENIKNFERLKKVIRTIVPANMVLSFSAQYTYIYLGRNYSYEQMEQYTYRDLSKYSDEYPPYTQMYLTANYTQKLMSQFTHRELAKYNN